MSRAARDVVPPGVEIPTPDVTSLVEEVLRSLEGDLSLGDVQLFREVEELARIIEQARRDLEDIGTHEIRDAMIPSATDQLDAIVSATEDATGIILDAAENLEGLATGLPKAKGAAVVDQVTRIYEACNFQDITGQRVSKVITALKSIETKVDAIVAAFGPDARGTDARGNGASEAETAVAPLDDSALLNGPSLAGEGISQDQVDALLASFD